MSLQSGNPQSAGPRGRSRSLGGDPEWDRLLSGLCDGTLSDADRAALGRRLAADPDARRTYREYVDLHAALFAGAGLGTVPSPTGTVPLLGGGPSSFPQAPPPPRVGPSDSVRRLGWAMIGLSAAAAAAVMAVSLSLSRDSAPSPDPNTATVAGKDDRAADRWADRPRGVPGDAAEPVRSLPLAAAARLTELLGRVELRGPDGGPAEAIAGAVLPAGRIVRTGPRDGFAVLELSDGSRLELGPDTQVRLADAGPSGAERVILSAGVLRAEVKPRADGRPLVVATPAAEVQASAGGLTVSASTPEATLLETEESGARMMRTSDGRSTEVPAGSWAMAAPAGDAEPLPVRAAPADSAPRARLTFSHARVLAYSADGRRLVVSSGAEWASLDAETGLPASEPVAFSPVRTNPTVSADGGTVVVWARDTGAAVYDSHLGSVRGTVAAGLKGNFVYAVSPDGTLAAAGHWTSGPPDEIRVWRTDDGSEAARLRTDSPVRAMAISPDNRRLAAVMDRTKRQHEVRIGVWDLTDRGVRRLTITTDRIVRALAFSPDGRRLAAGDEAGRVMLWDTGSGALLTGLGGEWVRPLRTLTWSPDGRIIAGGAADGRVHLWWPDAAGDTTALHCGKSSVTSLAFSPDGRTLAVGLVKGPVTIWEVPGRKDR